MDLNDVFQRCLLLHHPGRKGWFFVVGLAAIVATVTLTIVSATEFTQGSREPRAHSIPNVYNSLSVGSAWNDATSETSAFHRSYAAGRDAVSSQLGTGSSAAKSPYGCRISPTCQQEASARVGSDRAALARRPGVIRGTQPSSQQAYAGRSWEQPPASDSAGNAISWGQLGATVGDLPKGASRSDWNPCVFGNLAPGQQVERVTPASHITPVPDELKFGLEDFSAATNPTLWPLAGEMPFPTEPSELDVVAPGQPGEPVGPFGATASTPPPSLENMPFPAEPSESGVIVPGQLEAPASPPERLAAYWSSS